MDDAQKCPKHDNPHQKQDRVMDAGINVRKKTKKLNNNNKKKTKTLLRTMPTLQQLLILVQEVKTFDL